MPIPYKATENGSLTGVPGCYIKIPGAGDIELSNLPDISDTKSAVYNSEAIMGRAAPLYTYSHSGDRNLSIQLHFFIVDEGDGAKNLKYLRWLESAVYPRDPQAQGGSASFVPYKPPPICQIACGELLAKGDNICAVLQSYSVKFPTDVAWDISDFGYCPFRFDVDTNWIVVYTTSDLPFQDRIVTFGN